MGVVDKIFTDIAVISATPGGLVLEEVAEGWSPEEVQALTDLDLLISPNLREIAFA